MPGRWPAEFLRHGFGPGMPARLLSLLRESNPDQSLTRSRAYLRLNTRRDSDAEVRPLRCLNRLRRAYRWASILA